MSFGGIIKNTALMVLTGKIVNSGFEYGKKKVKEYKDRQAQVEGDGEDPKPVGSVTQMDDQPAA